MPLRLPQSFIAKKGHILKQLAVPAEQYHDLSPKDSVDEGIRDLIDEINALEGLVTTSSCGGRISVFLEGQRELSEPETSLETGDGDAEKSRSTIAGVGGKGGGGTWLFISHDPVDVANVENGWIRACGLEDMSQVDNIEPLSSSDATSARLIHFKFEPMILHVLTASLSHAQMVLAAALPAGFRESGALNLVSTTEHATPMVGIRSMGLALESVIGFQRGDRNYCMVPEWQLRNLMEISNLRFVENTKRIERFRALLRKVSGELGQKIGTERGIEWEDAQTRRDRMRAEGLERAQLMSKTKEEDQSSSNMPDLDLELIL